MACDWSVWNHSKKNPNENIKSCLPSHCTQSLIYKYHECHDYYFESYLNWFVSWIYASMKMSICSSYTHFFSPVYSKNIFSHKPLKLRYVLHSYSNLGAHLSEQIWFEQQKPTPTWLLVDTIYSQWRDWHFRVCPKTTCLSKDKLIYIKKVSVSFHWVWREPSEDKSHVGI